MKLVYTHPNRFLVLNAKNLLEIEHMTAVLRNEYSSGAAGELPPIDNWLELWITQDMHFDRAVQLLSSFHTTPTKDWLCRECDEQNGVAFEYCWQCNVFRNES